MYFLFFLNLTKYKIMTINNNLVLFSLLTHRCNTYNNHSTNRRMKDVLEKVSIFYQN